jgi:hypothetical protein
LNLFTSPPGALLHVAILPATSSRSKCTLTSVECSL